MGRMVEISRVKAELPTSYRTQRFSRRVIFCVCSIGTTFCQSCFRCLPVYHRNVKNTVISLQNPPASRPARRFALDKRSLLCYLLPGIKRKGWKDASFFLLNVRTAQRAVRGLLRPPAGNDPSRPPLFLFAEKGVSALPPAAGLLCAQTAAGDFLRPVFV